MTGGTLLSEQLEAEFPGWTIVPGRYWSADWTSEDGKDVRFITAPTAQKLAEQLRAIRDGES